MTEFSDESQLLDVTVDVNGKMWSGGVPAHETLLEFIRLRLGLTGTKRSCESQVCGACTVLVDSQPISACNYLAFEAHGKQVLTIEGLAQGEVLDPLQEAFLRNIGAQCGFCTPGQIMIFPPRITVFTFCVVQISLSGSPSTTMISAIFPASILPNSLSLK